MPKISLDEALVAKVRQPIHRVWNEIGGEVQERVAEEGEKPLGAAEIIEVCLDANYLTMYGFKEIDDLMGEAYQEHGEALYKFLAQYIRYA